MWKNIGNFLGRFTSLRLSQNLIKGESAKIIGEILNIEIKSKDIEERNGVLFFKSSNPVLKNEIFLKKNQILEALRKKLGNNSPKDLRF